MEKIHKLRVNDFIEVNDVKYIVVKIQVIKEGKCFRDHYGNTFLLKLQDKDNHEIDIKFNGKTIDDYIINKNI